MRLAERDGSERIFETSNGHAVAVLRTWAGDYVAVCGAGHEWRLSQTDVAQHQPRDWGHLRFKCEECYRALRSADVRAFDDPDYLRVDGSFE